MQNIYNIEEIPFVAPDKISGSSWTAIIPAAGRGTRLGSAEPKIFYSILGKTLLERCVERLQPYCQQFVFVLAPGVESRVRSRLDELIPGRFRLVIQEKPLGMGQAVQLCRAQVQTPHCVVMWIDQIALSSRTLSACLSLTERHPRAKLIFPTVQRSSPYIHFARDSQGRITGVLQAREGSVPLIEGENDCGVFFFDSAALFRALADAGDRALRGERTGEINLLPVIPLLDQYPGDVVTLRIQEMRESIGLNTPSEANQLEAILKNQGVDA